LRSLSRMLLCNGVLRTQGGDSTRCLAILLEDFGQLLDQPLLRDVRLPEGREHRSHRTLSYAKPTTDLGYPFVRSLRCGLDKHPHLLGRKAN